MKTIAIALCFAVIGVVTYCCIKTRDTFAQNLELTTEGALSHAYSRSELSFWTEKLGISDEKDKIAFAKSAHGTLQAGEEFLVCYARNTIEIDKLEVLETEKNYSIDTRIPEISLTGTRYGITPKIGDGGFVEIVRTTEYDAVYIYAGDG